MKTLLNNTLKTLAIGLVLAASVHSAQAAPIHTYVSRTGTDSGICSAASPCATFQYALSQTAAGGVISALDTGDYGPVTITQSVTIDGTGTQASIVTYSNINAITINGAAADTIILRHLNLTSVTTGSNVNDGADLNSGNLIVDDCKISGFSHAGIEPSNSSTLIVENTAITGCLLGMLNSSTGAVSLRTVILQGNAVGIDSIGGAADISHSLITHNGVGVRTYNSGTTLTVADCMISSNTTAVNADGGSTIRLTGNEIFNNATAINTANGVGIVSTAGNNHKAGSTTPGAPTPGKVIVTQ